MLTSPHFSADADNDAEQSVRRRVEQTRQRIASAALQHGRDPRDVGLVAVSKLQPVERIRTAAECGCSDFGENYVQEALGKMTALADLQATWHYIGQLQANKTRAVAEHFHWVHTVDRARIAQRLSEQRPAHASPLNVCIQVRLADEEGKGGVAPADLAALAEIVASLPRLALRGLMCIPPHRETFAEQRALFDQLANHQRQLCKQGFALDTLSMGMSADLEAAVAAGATWVRIGTALFGERPQHQGS